MHRGCKQWVRVEISVICTRHLITFWPSARRKLSQTSNTHFTNKNSQASLIFNKCTVVVVSTGGVCQHFWNSPFLFRIKPVQVKTWSAGPWPKNYIPHPHSWGWSEPFYKLFIGELLWILQTSLSVSFGREFRKLAKGRIRSEQILIYTNVWRTTSFRFILCDSPCEAGSPLRGVLSSGPHRLLLCSAPSRHLMNKWVNKDQISILVRVKLNLVLYTAFRV